MYNLGTHVSTSQAYSNRYVLVLVYFPAAKLWEA